MDRRDFNRLLPAMLLGLSPVVQATAPVVGEPLDFNDIMLESYRLGYWLQTWGEFDYPESHPGGRVVKAQVGLARIDPPYTINQLGCNFYSGPVYHGEVVAVRWLAPVYRFSTSCQEPSCPCYHVKPYYWIQGLGAGPKTVVLDCRTAEAAEALMRYKPCEFCGRRKFISFRHAGDGKPALLYCGQCSRDGLVKP